MSTKEQFNEANPLAEAADDYLEAVRGWAEKAHEIMDRIQLQPKCPKCGDPVLGDTDGLCRNCV